MASEVTMMIAFAGASTTLAALLYRKTRARRVRPGTVVDARDVDSVVQLVRSQDRGDGTDALVERLTRVYRLFPPTEDVMQRLSLFQQTHQGEGGLREFCVTTAFVVAQEVVVSTVL